MGLRAALPGAACAYNYEWVNRCAGRPLTNEGLLMEVADGVSVTIEVP